MKKNAEKLNNKGFTLVELLVVLVILAVLAAIGVSALLGYLDKSKEKAVLMSAETAYSSAKALGKQKYALSSSEPTALDVKNLGGFDGIIKKMSFNKGELDSTESKPFIYYEAGYTCTFAEGKWTAQLTGD